MTLPWGRLAVVAAAAGALAVTLADLHQHYRAPGGTAVAVGTVRAVALALCAVRPATAIVAVVAVGAVTSVVTTPTSAAEPWPWHVSSVIVLVMVLVLAGVVWPAGRPGLRVVLAAAVVTAQLAAAVTTVARDGRLDAGQLASATVLTAAAAVVGDLLAGRRRVGRQLAEQRESTAAEAAARVQGEERARIARELHDVVAHHLSVVVVRADSAPRRLAGLDEAAVAEFGAIGDDARRSLDEMRRVLRLLRPDGSREPLAPQPTLVDAADLVAEARAAGADVRLAGELPDVRGVVGLVGYRTLQEAITNALRHAPGLPVAVTVTRAPTTLRLAVENPAPDVRDRPGHGLRGMAERVHGAGGTVTAGPTGDGRFAVRAELPLGGAS